MSNSRDAFSYQPLSESSLSGSSFDELENSRTEPPFETRLIYLHPGGFHDCIYCTIYHANILEKRPQTDYTALSYVWGDATQKKTIQLGYHQLPTSETARTWSFAPSLGADCYKPFQVTKSLEKALRHLRDGASGRILWVNAICINQSDSKEKISQVQSMSDVYKNAMEVRIWLGSLSDVQEVIKRHQSRSVPVPEKWYPRLYIGEYKKTVSTWGRKIMNMALLAAKDYVMSGDRLLSQESNGNRFPAELQALGIRLIVMQPWWRRVWVIQEAMLSTEDPVMQCGDMQFRYRRFLEAATRYISLNTPSVLSQPHINLVVHGMFHGGYEPSETSTESRILTYLSCMSGNFEASDPKDRIHGVFGLLHPDDGITCFMFLTTCDMDRNRWVQKHHEFFHRVAVWILFDDKPQSYPLQILESGPSNIEGVPSWVPMWESKKWCGENKTYGAPKSKHDIIAQGVTVKNLLPIYGICTEIRIHDALEYGQVIKTLKIVPLQKRNNTAVLRKAIHEVEERILVALRSMDIPHADLEAHIRRFRDYLRLNFWDVDIEGGSYSSEHRATLKEFLEGQSESKKRKGHRRSTNVPSPASIAKLSSFFEPSRDLVVGSKIVGHIFEDEDLPPSWQCGDSLYLIPECRWVLGLRRSGSGYRYMYRVFISDLAWEQRKQTFNDQGTYEDIVLV
jgi:hypothetical protein